MTVPRFFQRVHAAVGRHVPIDSETLASRLENITIGVHCSSEGNNAARIGDLLVNQFSRLYPRLCIYGDGSTQLSEVARRINPDVDVVDDPAAATVTVSVVSDARGDTLFASADGWLASVGSELLVECEPNPFAAGAAAAIAASAVFRRVLLNDQDAWHPAKLELLTFGTKAIDHRRMLGPVNVGSLLVAGVGAVGNAALWTLARHPNVSGKALVLDPEKIELSNLQRYVLAMDADVDKEKVSVAGAHLAATKLDVTLLSGRLGDVVLPDDIANVLVTVDNVRGRRIAQALLPRLVVSGWTSESGLGSSWHDFHNGSACLACLYHPQGPAPSQTELVAAALGLAPDRAAILWVSPERLNARDTDAIATQLGVNHSEIAPWIGKSLQAAYSKLVCGSGAIPIGQHIETVPLVHQSVLAGVLAASELIKRLDPTLEDLPPQNLAAWHDVARPPPSVWLQHRNQEAGCICGDEDYREAFAAKWGERI